MTEVRVGTWLLESLRLRLAAAIAPARQDGAEPYLRQGRLDHEVKSNEELRCVLEVMTLFSADYLTGDEDGLPGLRKTFRQLRDSAPFTELGPKTSEKLDGLEAFLDALGRQLGVEFRAARKALDTPWT
jgi:hypothetical protein